MQPSGGLVPAEFRAASVTFVSTLEAFALGTAPCQHAPCTSIVRTRDRGVSWRGLPAPVVPLGEPGVTVTGPAVWGIRFATPEYGFVFGDGLWVTTDGGEHSSAAAYPGGSIVSLEIIDHQVLAVTMRRGMAGHAAGRCCGGLGRRGMDPARNASQRDREHRHPGAGGGDHRRHLRAGHG